jgi:hypothetical protein
LIGRLELGLIAQGVYDAFQTQIQKSENQPWSEVRDNYLQGALFCNMLAENTSIIPKHQM